MKNRYEIKDDKIIIYLYRKNGDRYETIVDIRHLKMLLNFDVNWYPSWSDNAKKYYVAATKYLGKVDGKVKYETHYLHRLITGANGFHSQVDHKNGKPMDNTDENLIITTHSNNSRNRKKSNINNKSGYRNVCWNKQRNKWMVQLQVDGKNKVLGYFEDVDKAGEFAKEMRSKYYGKFKGK